MLSNQEVHIVQALVAHARGAQTLTGEKLASLCAAADVALMETSAAKSAMSNSAKERYLAASAGKPAKQGKPATTWFNISHGSLWETWALGIRAAHAVVKETITECAALQPKWLRFVAEVPSINSLQVQMSLKGHWWRLVDDGTTEHGLTVRKATEAETAWLNAERTKELDAKLAEQATTVPTKNGKP